MAEAIETLKFNDLKAFAKAKGVDATGTKEDILGRLTDAGITTTDDESGGGDTGEVGGENTGANTSESGQGEAPKPSLTPAQDRAEQQKADRALKTDAGKMKAHLDSQRKVSIMIPFEVGENPEQGKKIPFHVNLNGYAMDFPRGQYIEVPEQVADIIKERLESEGKIGRNWRLDADSRKAEALS